MANFKAALIALILTVFLSAQAFAEPPVKKLKASPTLPPEAQKIEKDAKTKIPKPDERRLSVMEKKQLLQSMPGEREKLQKAKTKAKGPMLKASTSPPPEAQQIEKEAKAKIPKPDAKKLSIGELKRALRANPAEQHKLEKAERGFKPTSLLGGEAGSILTWLNPFQVPEANATISPVSITLNRNNNWFNPSPGTRAIIYGTTQGYGNSCFTPTMYHNNAGGGQYFDGYTWLGFNAPNEGWYILDFYVGAKNPARLDHYTGRTYEPIARWDFSNSGSYYNHYVTMQYLTQGSHFFKFKPGYLNHYKNYLVSISIDSWQ